MEKEISSEKYYEMHKKSAEELKEAKDREKGFKEIPIIAKVFPYYWKLRRENKEVRESKEADYNKLLEEVKGHAAEIEGEARNFVEARKAYEDLQQKLAEQTGNDPVFENMNDFINEMEWQKNSLGTSRSDMSQETKNISDYYKKNGEIMAIKDFFTPHLPESGKGGSSIKTEGGRSYRTYWGEKECPG